MKYPRQGGNGVCVASVNVKEIGVLAGNTQMELASSSFKLRVGRRGSPPVALWANRPKRQEAEAPA